MGVLSTGVSSVGVLSTGGVVHRGFCLLRVESAGFVFHFFFSTGCYVREGIIHEGFYHQGFLSTGDFVH